MTVRLTPSASLTTAVRRAARFDRGMVSLHGGLIAALPVFVVLGGGIAAGDAVAGVTMGAGAMLVGIAWRTRGGRPPLALMAADAGAMAAATFLGCVTGAALWLHLMALGVLALIGGLLVCLGPGGGVLGTQAVMAAIVFGRFSEPVPAALGIAGLVLAGGAAQVIFVSIVRWPSSLRLQRTATASAYRALAELAGSPPDASTLPAGAALDQAQSSLAAPALLGDTALVTLRNLVTEGQRVRVQLAAIHSLLQRRQQSGQAMIDPAVQATLGAACAELELDARAIEGDRAAAEELRRRAASQRPRSAAPPANPANPANPARTDPGALHLTRRLAALAGQQRALMTLAAAAGEGGGALRRRPVARSTRISARMRAYRSALRANASLDSPAGRHALRLAVVVVCAELISRVVPLQRSYWMVVAAATTLRPEFGATFTRGSERALGTCLGVALAGALAVGLHPAGGATVVLVGVLACAAYSVFPASFAAGFGCITALVVFLLNALSPDTLATAEARLLNTLVGAGFGLIAYAVWPTWARRSAARSLEELAEALRHYLSAVMAAVIDGRRADEASVGPTSRRARLARTTAESTVADSLSEPHLRRIDAQQSRGALVTMRRLVQAIHVLRLDAEDQRPRQPLPALAPLAAALDELLRAVQSALSDPRELSAPGPGDLPDLRAAYDAWERVCPDDDDGRALLQALDEIVDAANGLAAVLGMEPAYDADPQPA